jgi:hypothetical protein
MAFVSHVISKAKIGGYQELAIKRGAATLQLMSRLEI